jgi:hypothetical protein
MNEPIRPGRYRHFKGGEYEVLGVARHSETEEHLVVYRALQGDEGLWVRPLKMFMERVTLGSRTVLRFEYVGDGSKSGVIAGIQLPPRETDRP